MKVSYVDYVAPIPRDLDSAAATSIPCAVRSIQRVLKRMLDISFRVADCHRELLFTKALSNPTRLLEIGSPFLGLAVAWVTWVCFDAISMTIVFTMYNRIKLSSTRCRWDFVFSP